MGDLEVRNSSKMSGNYHERLVADIVQLSWGRTHVCMSIQFQSGTQHGMELPQA